MRVLACAFVVVLISACGFSKGGSVNTSTSTTGDGDGDIDAGAGAECAGSGQSTCQGGTVCDPVTQTCQVPQGTCASQGECTGGTYCEVTEGVCLPSTVGSPCGGPDNCAGNDCINGICGCDAVVNERQLSGSPLDIFLMLDRSGSMLDGPDGDCAYDSSVPVPPQDTKGCYATYALADYVINQVKAEDDIQLAFDVMSLHNDCTGAQHDDPEVPMTLLPVAESSTLVNRINSEDFSGGFGTQIEGALRGIASFTGNAANRTAGREMIGVFITDGEPTDCDRNVTNLAAILSTHRTNTSVRTFIIGMTGSNDQFLETLAIAGGADEHADFCGTVTPPCHYFNVGDGNGAVLADALKAISQQAVEIPCDVDVSNLQAPQNETVDYAQVNVTFNDGNSTQIIGQVADAGSCPVDGTLAWYYDNPSAPTTIFLCESACTAVTQAGDGANLAVVAGCNATVIID